MGKQRAAAATQAPAAASPGPLARWRLLIAVAVAGATTGSHLVHSLQAVDHPDTALLRSFGVWFLTWIAVGTINRVLRQAEADQRPRLAVVPDLPAADGGVASSGADPDHAAA